MAKVKIGMGRFYNAKFCTVKDQNDICWQLDYANDIAITCKLSKHTEWSPIVFQLEEDKENFTLANTQNHKYPADLYLEVNAYKWIEIDELTATLLPKNLETRNEVYKKYLLYEKELILALNYSAGMLGLVYHQELVRVPILEVDQKYIFINENLYALESTLPIEVKSPVNFDIKKEHCKVRVNVKYKNNSFFKKASDSLEWLLRGWAAEDYVLKFISFFTALEPIIPEISKTEKENFKLLKSELLEYANSKSENSDLINYIKNLNTNISLAPRFDCWAEDLKLDNWEKDIVDFRKYYKIRNNLLHKGDASIAQTPFLTNEDLEGLAFLSEKYLKFTLFNIRKNSEKEESRKVLIKSTMNIKI